MTSPVTNAPPAAVVEQLRLHYGKV